MQVLEGTDSECIECTLLPEKRTLELQRLCSERSGVPQTLRSRVAKLFLEEDAGLLTLVCNLKKTKLNETVAARPGDDFEMEWDNLLTSLSTDSVRNTREE